MGLSPLLQKMHVLPPYCVRIWVICIFLIVSAVIVRSLMAPDVAETLFLGTVASETRATSNSLSVWRNLEKAPVQPTGQ